MVDDQGILIEVATCFVKQSPVWPIEREIEKPEEDRCPAKQNSGTQEQCLRDVRVLRYLQGYLPEKN